MPRLSSFLQKTRHFFPLRPSSLKIACKKETSSAIIVQNASTEYSLMILENLRLKFNIYLLESRKSFFDRKTLEIRLFLFDPTRSIIHWFYRIDRDFTVLTPDELEDLVGRSTSNNLENKPHKQGHNT